MIDILLKPVISEKTMQESEIYRRYTFLVNNKANKFQISNEINKLFSVNVIKVRTMIYAPDINIKYTKRGRQISKSKKLKKAIIDLAEGSKINIYGDDI